uniref:Uncharacterized protein n=1 Tax=Globisporangium ultimum (strain ATCC 200006 / CBS 805.95 / DAOM BR144) TaxID=431595 RepID=K3XCU8_GLOUD
FPRENFFFIPKKSDSICLNGGRNSDGLSSEFLVGQLTEVYKERNGISLLDCFKSQCLMKIKEI